MMGREYEKRMREDGGGGGGGGRSMREEVEGKGRSMREESEGRSMREKNEGRERRMRGEERGRRMREVGGQVFLQAIVTLCAWWITVVIQYACTRSITGNFFEKKNNNNMQVTHRRNQHLLNLSQTSSDFQVGIRTHSLYQYMQVLLEVTV